MGHSCGGSTRKHPQLLLPMASFFNESSLATSKEEARNLGAHPCNRAHHRPGRVHLRTPKGE